MFESDIEPVGELHLSDTVEDLDSESRAYAACFLEGLTEAVIARTLISDRALCKHEYRVRESEVNVIADSAGIIGADENVISVKICRMERIVEKDSADLFVGIADCKDVHGRIADTALFAAVSADALLCAAVSDIRAEFGVKGVVVRFLYDLLHLCDKVGDEGFVDKHAFVFLKIVHKTRVGRAVRVGCGERNIEIKL